MDFLTIFTPTYNRAHLLPRLFDSLKSQDCLNFEWIIVDDDSSDNTQQLVETFCSEQLGFPIKYIKQVHGGKHRAINKALTEASGEFFFVVDSDDYLTKDAVEQILQWVDSISGIDEICGVSGLRVSETSKVVGGNVVFPDGKEYIDASSFERGKYGLGGDKAEVFRTSLLKKYPFPEFENEYFITEAVCWNALAADGYKIRWFNKPIYVCEYLEGGLSQTGANSFEGHVKNYRGYCCYIQQCIEVMPKLQGITHFREFNKTAKKLNKGFLDRAEDLNISFAKYIFLYVFEMPLLYSVRIIKKTFKFVKGRYF